MNYKNKIQYIHLVVCFFVCCSFFIDCFGKKTIRHELQEICDKARIDDRLSFISRDFETRLSSSRNSFQQMMDHKVVQLSELWNIAHEQREGYIDKLQTLESESITNRDWKNVKRRFEDDSKKQFLAMDELKRSIAEFGVEKDRTLYRLNEANQSTNTTMQGAAREAEEIDDVNERTIVTNHISSGAPVSEVYFNMEMGYAALGTDINREQMVSHRRRQQIERTMPLIFDGIIHPDRPRTGERGTPLERIVQRNPKGNDEMDGGRVGDHYRALNEHSIGGFDIGGNIVGGATLPESLPILGLGNPAVVPQGNDRDPTGNICLNGEIRGTTVRKNNYDVLVALDKIAFMLKHMTLYEEVKIEMCNKTRLELINLMTSVAALNVINTKRANDKLEHDKAIAQYLSDADGLYASASDIALIGPHFYQIFNHVIQRTRSLGDSGFRNLIDSLARRINQCEIDCTNARNTCAAGIAAARLLSFNTIASLPERASLDAVNKQLADMNADLKKVNDRIATLPVGHAAITKLTNKRNALNISIMNFRAPGGPLDQATVAYNARIASVNAIRNTEIARLEGIRDEVLTHRGIKMRCLKEALVEANNRRIENARDYGYEIRIPGGALVDEAYMRAHYLPTITNVLVPAVPGVVTPLAGVLPADIKCDPINAVNLVENGINIALTNADAIAELNFKINRSRENIIKYADWYKHILALSIKEQTLEQDSSLRIYLSFNTEEELADKVLHNFDPNKRTTILSGSSLSLEETSQPINEIRGLRIDKWDKSARLLSLGAPIDTAKVNEQDGTLLGLSEMLCSEQKNDNAANGAPYASWFLRYAIEKEIMEPSYSGLPKLAAA